MKILTPATTANIGPGFDIFGLSYKYFDEFQIKQSSVFNMKNTDEKYNNEDNIFFVAYKEVAKSLGLDRSKKCEVCILNHYPFFRGLGSSASLVVAGAYAANNLYEKEINKKLSKDELFKICTKIEGHPDNAAPCIYGGVNVSFIENDIIHRKRIIVSNKLHATVFIPNYETSTEEARKILKQEVSLKNAIKNVAHSIFLLDALKDGDIDKLKFAIEDEFHVPYRKTLIKDYDYLKNICNEVDNKNAFTISGSGSTMVCFTEHKNFADMVKIKIKNDNKDELLNSIEILDLDFDEEGAVIWN